MTRWASQRGQCLICYYGLSIRPVRQLRSYATSFRSTVRPKRLRKSTHQEDREERWIERQLQRGDGDESGTQRRFKLRLDARGGPKFSSDFSSGTKSVNLTNEEEEEDGQVNIIQRLEKCLRDVWSTQGADATAHKQLLADLDPKGERWKKFVDDIRQLFGMPNSKLNGDKKRLYADISQSLTSESYKANTVRLLRFSFMDEALKAQGFSFHDILGHVPDLQSPTEWYPNARATQRQIHLHVGPTNSGKTYNALKRLEAARSGYYAGPLRLLAHEVYSRFLAKGIPCDLVTGDDVRVHEDEETRRSSSTVEMVGVARACEVAVIDEIQMIADEKRGWAWTRALIGTQANEVHLCGEERVVPLIQELAATMGDNLQIHRYERLNPLKVMSKSLRGDLKNLRKGDCVVSFSVMSIHAMKKQIEKETGRHAAIVYGSLPPETRAQQAALFNDPDNDYDFLVASDAIGMGLNLSIKRIIFESMNKFNGIGRERISISQIKQIAGRAGRYRTAREDANQSPRLDVRNPDPKEREQQTIGLVTCLDENDLPIIRDAMSTEATPITQAGILPPGQYIEEFHSRLPPSLPFEYLFQRVCKAATVHPRYKVCDVDSQLKIARSIESVQGLDIVDRFTCCASPADPRSGDGEKVLRRLTKCIAERKEVTVADVSEIPLEILEHEPSFDRGYLSSLEVLHKALILYLWLAYRFSSIFKDMDMAFHAKELTEEKINICLTKFSANPMLRQRLKRMKSEYTLSLESIQDSSEGTSANTPMSAESMIGQDEELVDGSQEKAPMEDESSELELAIKEMEGMAGEVDEGSSHFEVTDTHQDKVDEPLPAPIELQDEAALSSKQREPKDTSADPNTSIAAFPTVDPDAPLSEPTLTDESTSDPRPDETSITKIESPPPSPLGVSNNNTSTQRHRRKAPQRISEELVFIPTDGTPNHDGEAANVSK